MEEHNEKVLSEMERSGEGISSKLDDTSDKVLLLGDRHKEAGIECNGCHIVGSNDNEVSTAVCITCHEDIAGIASQDQTGESNPHNSHMMFSECGDCHHLHKPSEDQCQGCHTFNFQIP